MNADNITVKMKLPSKYSLLKMECTQNFYCQGESGYQEICNVVVPVIEFLAQI